MARIYLEPEDVGAADARMVLDFLNAATTAQEIADTVEIPNELDIGIRLAQRLLDRRGELGGAFATLQQIADVPLIGPERFTEIVTTLSAARVPQASVPSSIDEQLRALRRDLDALRAGSGGAAASPALTLTALQSEPFLGQSVNVVARATQPGSDLPLIGATVVLATTWGQLRGVEGVQLRDGHSLRLRTGVDGAARAVLTPPTSEEVSQVQQATLETALQSLDPTAPTPSDTRAGLEALARRYNREGEDAFRQAVDVYFRDFGGQATQPINPTDPLAAWSYFQATLVAYLPDAEFGSAVRAVAVLPLWLRDWLAPWLEVHENVVAAGAVLDSELVDLVRARVGTEGAGSVLGRVYARIQDYVDDQRGVVGALAGRRVAERSLTAVLDAGLADATAAERVAIFPGAELGTRLLATAPTSVLASIGDARTDLRRDLQPQLDTDFGQLRTSLTTVESQLSTRGDEIGTLTGRMSTLETTMVGKADVSRVSALEAADRTRADSLTALTQQLGSLTTRLDDFEIDIRGRFDTSFDANQFAAFRDDFTGQLAAVRDDVDQRLAGFQGDVDQRFAGFQGDVDQRFAGFQGDIDQRFDAKADTARVDALEANAGPGAEQLGALTERMDGLQLTLDGKLDAAHFSAFQADIGGQLGAKADATRVSTLEASLGDVTRQFGGFAGQLDGVQRSLDGKLDSATFETFQADTSLQLETKADATRVNALESSVSRMGDDVASIGSRIDGVESGLTDVRLSLDGKLDTQRFATLEGSVGDMTTQVETFDTRLDGVEAGIDAKLDTAQFTTFEADVSRQLGTKASTTDVATIATRVDGIQTTLTTVQSSVAGKLDASQFTTFQTSVSQQLATKADTTRVAALETSVATSASRISALQTTTSGLSQSVGTLSTSVSGLSTSVNGLNTDVTTLRRNINPRQL